MNVQPAYDHDVVLGLQQSSEEAFKTVYDTYASRLYGYAFRFVKHHEVSEEIVQEAMLTLWEKRETLNERYPIGSILYTITKHLAINHLRKVANSRSAMEEFWKQIQTEANSTQEAIETLEMKDCLAKALRQLPKQQQLIFRMSRYDGYSHEQIALKLNISKNTVKNHLVTALRRLKTQFRDLGVLYFLVLSFFIK